MAGTFSQIYIQIIFAVKGRQSRIELEWEEDLYKYVRGMVKKRTENMTDVLTEIYVYREI